MVCSWFARGASHAHKKKNTKKGPPRGLGGVLIFFYPKSYFFCDLKPHAKFRNPTINLSGRKVCGTERKRKIIPNIAHALRADQLRDCHPLWPRHLQTQITWHTLLAVYKQQINLALLSCDFSSKQYCSHQIWPSNQPNLTINTSNFEHAGRTDWSELGTAQFQLIFVKSMSMRFNKVVCFHSS